MSDRHPILPARLDTRGVVAAYRRIAPIYDLWGRATESRAHDLCMEWLDLDDVRQVLDVATGTGALLRKVLAAAPEAEGTGIDISPAMLARAAARAGRSGPAYRLVLADARRLPIRGGSVDLLLNSYMFDLLPTADFGAVLAEFRRVLGPAGRLALINMTVPERGAERIWEAVYRVRPALLGGCRGVRMTEHLDQAGFRVERYARVSQLAFPSEVLLARPAGDASEYSSRL